MTLTDSEFIRLVEYMKYHTGIDLHEKRVLCSTRLDNFLSRNGYANLDSFLNKVIEDNSGREAEKLINLLTTNHTFFWREEKHFEYMLDYVLPEMRKMCERNHDLRIWCAASSTGEEPYTLAMLNMEYFGSEKEKWDTTVLATDISTKVLKKAELGIYNKEAIQNLPIGWQKKYFKQNGDLVEVKQELKREVLFRRLNLVEKYPFRKPLHIIFVRNVLIYFDDKTKRQIIDKMVDNLIPGGYLFIGTTESVSRDTDALEYVAPAVYRKIRSY